MRGTSPPYRRIGQCRTRRLSHKRSNAGANLNPRPRSEFRQTTGQLTFRGWHDFPPLAKHLLSKYAHRRCMFRKRGLAIANNVAGVIFQWRFGVRTVIALGYKPQNLARIAFLKNYILNCRRRAATKPLVSPLHAEMLQTCLVVGLREACNASNFSK